MVQIKSKIFPLSISEIQKILSLIFNLLKKSSSSCDVTVVGKQRIQSLNNKYRRKNKVTDVLSFPLYSSKDAQKKGLFLGDVVICLPQIIKQAKDFKRSVKEEFYLMLTHGVLHLLGYDHEISEKEALKMRRLEVKILKKIMDLSYANRISHAKSS